MQALDYSLIPSLRVVPYLSIRTCKSDLAMAHTRGSLSRSAIERHLRKVLPLRGFVYPRTKYILSAHTATKVLLALRTWDRDRADDLLAKLFTAAGKLRPECRDCTVHFATLFREAGEQVFWSCHLGGKTILALMLALLRGRGLYIKFSGYRTPKNLAEDNTKLAKAIDSFTGTVPAAKPDELFDDWSKKELKRMMDRIRETQAPEWHAEEEEEDEDQSEDGGSDWDEH